MEVQDLSYTSNQESGKVLSLEDVQKVCTDILFDVHDFCVKHNIKYSLAYGTLIGALRHKGFIPWDDDVDIVMPRKDFDRFCKEYKSEKGFKVLDPNSSESLITFGRVYDINSTRCETIVPWSAFETGVWVDVFPLDGVEDDYNVFLKRIKRMRSTATRIMMKRTTREGFWSTKSPRRKCTWVIKTLLTAKYRVDELKWAYLNEMQRYDFDTANYFGQLGCYDDCTHKEHNPKSDFTHLVEVDFEGRKLLAMNGYDNILRRYYGDYMQLPPLNQQKPKIVKYLKFYWK